MNFIGFVFVTIVSVIISQAVLIHACESENPGKTCKRVVLPIGSIVK